MMYARTVPGPEKQPKLREFLDEPDTPLTFDIWLDWQEGVSGSSMDIQNVS